MTSLVPDTIGVVGAGTMGAGIAQIAARTGSRVLLYDAKDGAAERGLETLGTGLRRQVDRGRTTQEDADALLARIEPVAALGDLAPAGLVIEAAPERLELKIELFSELAGVLADDAVLATNTSSLSVTELAAGVPGPERVVGMHFFNPPPVMKLMEVVAAAQSADAALAVARATGEAMGKHVVAAQDVAGFLVNRCNRPYSLESLRLLQEQVADVATIDRIARTAGGFRMGPFELMDLIGIETNHAVAVSFTRLSFGEPRYRPSPIQARMVAAGRLGRKTGRGWYAYADGEAHRPDDPTPPTAGRGSVREVVVRGDLPVLDELRSAIRDAGWTVLDGVADTGAWLTVDAGPQRDGDPDGPRARLLHDGSLHALEPTAAGFHLLAPLAGATAVEVTSTDLTAPDASARLYELLLAIGRRPEPVADAPGLVLGRVVAQLINEAAFLIGEGNGTPEDVDAGMTLGVNHPRGPVAWSTALGLAHVVSLLDALHRETGEPAYRVAPLLRRRLAVGGGLGDA